MAFPDRLPRPENTTQPEIRVAPAVIDALRGKVIPIRDGSTFIVIEGSGQFGLTNLADNKKWSGIFHHSILTGRLAAHLSEQVRQKAKDKGFNQGNVRAQQTIDMEFPSDTWWGKLAKEI